MPQPYTFVRKLRRFNLARKRSKNGVTHDDMARALGIKKALMQSWLYRNAPTELMATMLMPKLEALMHDDKKIKND